MSMLFNIIIRLCLWAMIYANGVLVAKAFWNCIAPASAAYDLPMDKFDRFTKVTFSTDARSRVVFTRSGRPSGVAVTVTGSVRNDSDRTLVGLDMRCRWDDTTSPTYEQGRAAFTANFNIPPHSTGSFSHTYTYEHALSGAGVQHCFVEDVKELDTWSAAKIL